MPTVRYEGREIECENGAVLRDVLLAAGETPHNGPTQGVNCRGHATCGTCAVAVEGPTDEMGTREELRLSVPPHVGNDGLRLACQTRVLGDLAVEKHGGYWGQHAPSTDTHDPGP